MRSEELRERLDRRGIACALEGTELANEMIAKAQFLISAAYELAYQKRKGQIFISTWHGFALKLTGFFESAVIDPAAFHGIRAITTQFDAVTMTSQAARLFFAGMHACDPRKVFATGFPRNDFLFSEDGRDNLLKITDCNLADSKLILYLPTMRKSLKEEGAQFESNIFNYDDFDPIALNDFLEENGAYLFVKLHPSDSALFDLDEDALPPRIILLDEKCLEKEFLTLYHVLNGFDCLITDYSSVYVDYLLLNRPIVFSCPDLRQYEHDRGFCVDDPTLLMPGALVKNMDDLIRSLDDIVHERDNHAAERSRILPFFHTHVDGNASQRTYGLMQSALESLPPDIAKDSAADYFKPNTPLYQYSLDVVGDIYVDYGRGFNDQDKIPITYNAQDELSVIEVDIPASACNMRFDPSEFGRFALSDLEVKIDNTPARYELIGGTTIGGITYLPKTDPRIVIPLSGQKSKRLSITFKAIDAPVLDEGNVDTNAILIEAFNAKSSMRNRIRNSRFWKAAQALRRLMP